ncbi:MAG: DUF104 domain-containing protein [Treponema sp.]|nr:DUF104 domain-containing protein [Treponema sp.]
MLVITGTFENERFIPDKPVSIPQKRRVKVTIEEENEDRVHISNNTSGSSMRSVEHSAFGRLHAYANPSLISEEQGAWEAAVAEKYALR